MGSRAFRFLPRIKKDHRRDSSSLVSCRKCLDEVHFDCKKKAERVGIEERARNPEIGKEVKEAWIHKEILRQANAKATRNAKRFEGLRTLCPAWLLCWLVKLNLLGRIARLLASRLAREFTRYLLMC